MTHNMRIALVIGAVWAPLLLPWGRIALAAFRLRARRHQAWRRRNRIGWPKGMPNCDKQPRAHWPRATVRGRRLTP